MQMLKGIFKFYINSSIHVALAVCSLVLITSTKFDLNVRDSLYFFVFFATISGYNFVKYFGLAKFHHRRLARWLKQIQIFSFLCFIPLIYFSLKLNEETIILLGILGLITFFYAIPFLPRSLLLDRYRNLRAISGLKIYVIAFVWAVVTVVLPAVATANPIDHDLVVECVQRGLYVIVATLPFEIRDLQYDSLKLATIPQQIGVRATKWVGTVLLFVFVALNWYKDHLWIELIMTDVLIGLVMLFFLWLSKTSQSDYYTSFWVEGIPLFWLILVLII